MSAPARISQQRLRSRGRGSATGAYDPAVASDGMTLDTPAGPVDLAAVQRVLRGEPTPVTRADIAYVIALLPSGEQAHTEPVARGLGLDLESVKRAVQRRTARQRSVPEGGIER